MPDPSPFTSLSRHVPVRTSSKRRLLALSRSIEARALADGHAAELWICIQHARFHSGLTRQIHRDLTLKGVTVHVYGVGVRDGAPHDPGLHRHDVSEFGLLAQEWNVLLVTPDEGLGLAARQVEPLAPRTRQVDLETRFDWVISENRADVVYAAAALPTEPFVLGHDFRERSA